MDDPHGRTGRPQPGGHDSDPLAELARLIGQTDPFANFGREGSQPQTPPAPHVEAFPLPPTRGPAATTQTGGWRKAAPPRDDVGDAPVGFDARPSEMDPRFAFPPEQADEFQGQAPPAEPHAPAWTRHAADARMSADDDGAPPVPAFLRGAHPATPPPASPSAAYDRVLYGEELPLTRHAEPNPYASHDGHATPDGPRYDAQPYDAQPYGAAPHAAQSYDSYDPYAQHYGPAPGDDTAGAYADGDYAEERQPPRRKNGGLVTVLAIVVLAVVGTAGAYAYRSFFGTTRTGPPPVIKAENGANKIVPPRNEAETNGKLIYDRIGNNPAESKIVSREEQPIAVGAGTTQSPRVVFPALNPPNQQPAAQSQPRQDSIAAVIAANGNPAQAVSPADEPKKIRTLSIRPDQPVGAPPVPDNAGSAAQATPEPRVQPPPAVRSQRTAATTPEDSAPINLAPQARQSAVATPNVAAGGYLVQVSSQRSDADARASFRTLQGKYPAVLGSRDVVVRRIDLGSRGVYYRAMVGPFASASEASQICSDLKSNGGQCVIQRN